MAGNRRYYQEAMARARSSIARQDWQQAIGVVKVAIREFPHEPEPYDVLGQACIGLKAWDKALDCYKLAARFSLGNISFLNRVADMQERLGQLDEAGRTYMAAGELLLRRQDLDGAVDNWLRAVRLEPGLLSAHRRLAMVYQRLNNVRAAVREYLAIARILAARGERRKALQMCHAAMRLDPDNEDIVTAMALIRQGEEALPEAAPETEPEKETPAEEEGSLADTIRQMAAVLEEERQQHWRRRPAGARPETPLETARRLASQQLTAEIFRDEEDENLLYGSNQSGLSKLERDALIGQGIDFQSRGQPAEAISCYEQAIKGGLRLPAAYFTLGMLYLETGRPERARRVLSLAARTPDYREAAAMAQP